MDARQSPPSTPPKKKKKKKRPGETPNKMRPNSDPLTLGDESEESKEFPKPVTTIQSILKKTTEAPKKPGEVKIHPLVTVQEYDPDPFVKKEEVKPNRDEEEKLEEWKKETRTICKCWLSPELRNAHSKNLTLLYVAAYEAEAAENYSQEAVNHVYESVMTYISHQLLESVLSEASSYIESLENMRAIPEWKKIVADAISVINTILNLIRQKSPEINCNETKAFDRWLDKLTDLTEDMSHIKEIVTKITEGEDKNSEYSVIDRVCQLEALKDLMDKMWLTSLGDSHINALVGFESDNNKKKVIRDMHAARLKRISSVKELGRYVKELEDNKKRLEKNLRADIAKYIKQLVERDPDVDEQSLVRKSYELPLQPLKTLGELVEYKNMLIEHLRLQPPAKKDRRWSISLFESARPSVLSEAPSSMCSPLAPGRSPKGSIG